MTPPDFRDIAAAAAVLDGVATVTPLLESPLLNDRLGGRLLIKAEPLQRTGSFKFRGAYNRIRAIPEADRARGVVAYSSGNHAQGVAAAARLLDLPATIIMPNDAPAIKRDNTRAWGGRVIGYDRFTEDREAIGRRLTGETGATLVPPYDDPLVMAGQGTIGVEIDAQAAGIEPAAVLAPCGGGGMIGGLATALAHLRPGLPVWAVEPESFDDTRRSLATGTREGNAAGARSICDSLLAPKPGELTFSVNRRLLAGGLAVGDDEVAVAMRTAFAFFKLVVEPGGAVALAAVLSGRFPIAGKTVVVVCSGGNVDEGLFAQMIAGPGGGPEPRGHLPSPS